jgi:hypothetical protein
LREILLLGKNVGEAMELLMKMNFDRALFHIYKDPDE